MQKRQLSKREIKEINDEVKQFDFEIQKKDKVELSENDVKILLINNEPMFFYYEDKIFPTLKAIPKKNTLKTVTVDMGAVKFVVNGADVMRPGVTQCNPGIKKYETVVVIDETHNKPIAVGIALYSDKEIINMNSGKVIKNIHWVGDEIWSYQRVIKRSKIYKAKYITALVG